jgi:hypothetical protein
MVKITGRGVEIVDEATRKAFREDERARSGFDPGTAFHLFRVDVGEAATLRPAPDGDYLLIEWWREGEPPKRVERR